MSDIFVWTPGPPPRHDDGTLVLVRLKASATLYEHYCEPIIVSCWLKKLKTTVEPLRIEYEDVALWMPMPSVHLRAHASTGQPAYPEDLTRWADELEGKQ